MRKQLLFLWAVLLGSCSFAQTGGPDGAGYTYTSSDAVSGPVYNWIELDTAIGGSGTWSTANATFDGHQGNIPLGFTFPFYGNNYNSISISTNGTVYFEDFSLTWANVCLPGDPFESFSNDTAIIATVWQDLYTMSGPGVIYYQDFGTHFVVEYSDVPEWGGIDGDTWELILYPSGDIIMQFKETSLISGWGHTTGIQGSPTLGLDYYCSGGGDPIHDSLAILWTSPFIGISELDQMDVTIYPNPNNGEFELSFNSGFIGNYSVEITDVNGTVVYLNSFKKGTGLESISLNDPSVGVYYVAIYNESYKTVKKVFVE